MSSAPSKELSYKAELIFQTSQMLHSQVKVMLDKSMIDQSAFSPQLEHYSLKRVLEDATNIMKGQASVKKIKLQRIFAKNDLTVRMDRMRSL